jgi:hypothetical protein
MSSLPDGDHNTVKVAQHIKVSDAEHSNALLCHPYVADRDGWRIYVGDTIHFNHQAGGRAVEVRDELTKWHLSPKLQAP